MSTEHLIGDIGLVLDALMGAADQARQEAEVHLRTITLAQPADVLLVLAQIGAQGVGGFQLDHRFLALLILKRLAFQPLPNLFLNENATTASSPFDVVNERVRGRIEVVLCAGVKDEMDTRMRKGIGNCVASWAQESASRHRPFLALPPVLLQLTASPHPFHRFTPFQLLDLCPALLVDSVTDPIPATQLAQILLAGLNDPSGDVRVEAMKALRSVVLEALTGREREQVGPNLVLEAFKTLPRLPTGLLSHALLILVDLVSLHPMLFVPSLDSILPYLLSLISPPIKKLSPAHQFSAYPASNLAHEDWLEFSSPATEMLMTLIEFKQVPVLRWQDGRVVKEMVGSLFGALVLALEEDGEECTDWLENEDLENEDEIYSSIPEETFDRLANSLGGSLLLPAISSHVQTLLQHPYWRCRFSSLILLSCVAEGCIQEMTPRIGDILNLISPCARDPHPRVRYAFVHVVGRFCSDLGGVMQEQYAKAVLTIFIELLSDPAARVREHAGGAICNFFNNAESDQAAPFTAGVLRTLLDLYPQGPKYAQEQWIASIGTVSTSASQELFEPFYREVMGLMFRILRQGGDASRYKVIGRALETASLAGVAAGKKLFSSDAVALVEIMLVIQNSVKGSEDPRASFLMEAWSNICSVLGNDFTPFLTYVIPQLLESAAWTPTRTGQSEFSMKEETDSNDDYAHTSEMDEKIVAFEHLTGYAAIMQGAFKEWITPCLRLGMEGLVFKPSEGVREAAAAMVPVLLMAAKEAQVLDQGGVEHVIKTLINAIAVETDNPTLALLYRSLQESESILAVPLSPSNQAHYIRTCSTTLSELSLRRRERHEQEKYMDEGDRELYLQEQAEEDEVLSQMMGCVSAVRDVGNQQGTTRDLRELMDIIKRVKKEGLRLRASEGGRA